MTDRPALLLYCQHSLGLGHLKRSWALADALSADFRIVLLSGGVPPRDLPPPARIEIVHLPPLAQNADGRLVALDDSMSVDEARRNRCGIILDTFRALRPAVVLIELFPFGRRKFAGELMPLLEDASSGPRPLVACSVRDILVGRGSGQQAHDDRARALVDAYFDAVFVHTDRQFAALDETFRPRQPLQTPVYYTGFVVSGAKPPVVAARDGVLVSGGGGRFAEPLFTTAIEAHAQLSGPTRLTIVAGPLCEDSTWHRLVALAGTRSNIRLQRTVLDLCGEMARSQLSISQCGYNTALDIIRARVPALVVPFADGGDSEQADRARRLEALHAVRTLPADRLSAPALAAAIAQMREFQPAPVSLALDGAGQTARFLKTLLRGRHEAQVTAPHEPRHEQLA